MRAMRYFLPVLAAFSIVGGGVFLAAPAAEATPPPDHKSFVCHNTHSAKNPTVLIHIDNAAVAAHETNHGDTSSATEPTEPCQGAPD